MSDHVFRNPDHADGSRHLRDLIRDRLPNGSAGNVAFDLDGIVKWFGPRYGLDDEGLIALLEIKHGDAALDYSAKRVFREIDGALRRGFAPGRYRGFYLLHDYGDGTYRFGRTPVGSRISADDLVGWLTLQWETPALFYNEPT